MDNLIMLQSFGVTVNWTVSCSLYARVRTSTKRPARRQPWNRTNQMTKFLLEILTFSHGSESGIYLRSLPLLRSDLLRFPLAMASGTPSRTHRPGVSSGAGSAPPTLGPRSASNADLSDSPAAKTRLIFKTNDNFDTDIKTGIEGLVQQLNTQWGVLTDRIDAVEKFEKGFTNNTLPIIQTTATDMNEAKTKFETISEVTAKMGINKEHIDSTYQNTVKMKADIEALMGEGRMENLVNQVKLLEATVEQAKVDMAKVADGTEKTKDFVNSSDKITAMGVSIDNATADIIKSRVSA